MSSIMQPILQVKDLCVQFKTVNGIVTAVNHVSFDISQGETVALVGESGSGKSVTSLGIMRLTPPTPRVSLTGEVLFQGPRDEVAVDLLKLSEKEMRERRGRDIAMVFQEPMTSFNPLHTIGRQIAEGVRLHHKISKAAALDRAVELLDMVGISAPRERLNNYPHEMSGGMRQRAMIAMALANDPCLLIADEPTTALDVTIQAQITELLLELQQKNKMGLLFITHNLGVVAEIADRVMVMYCGQIVEQASVDELFEHPSMPYTQGLLKSVPRLQLDDDHQQKLPSIPGYVPSPFQLPQGCKFGPRCDYFKESICHKPQSLAEIRPSHWIRCERWEELEEGA
ncbi:ABC transporter ATP-binding protein [Pelistega suis]|uniref:ABC transporter ATP-binding protein n=2 Tax=Pelistega suis TaxID=1631957 RepID=A0A849NYD3_9BURK|nr:ABC transporter ATP-binding protein [Pelistega suis]